MRPQELIAKKRDGLALNDKEIGIFVNALSNGIWADYQISALVMAMFLNGVNQREQDEITRAMLHSGTIMDFSDIDAPKADKHSTGGVGDKTSLIIAPAAAACGIAVPMVSGRGLGHTGGTLDKLEAIPGYNVNLTFAELKEVIREVGFGMIGQTEQIAPADKKLYALRDATATVPYIPLIVASIMSKKLAEGLDALVLDVKTGSGAFIKQLRDSVRLAESLCATGNAFKVNTVALVTDMSEPLGKYVGNAVETYECIKIMRGEMDPQMAATLELSVELTARMVINCGLADSPESARAKVTAAIDSGQALERFRRNIELQGGDPTICDRPETLLTKGLVETEVLAAGWGFVTSIDTFAVGTAIVGIGGGRSNAEDGVDHAVGYVCHAKLGDHVEPADPLGIIYSRTEDQANSIVSKLSSAYQLSPEKSPDERKLIKQIVGF